MDAENRKFRPVRILLGEERSLIPPEPSPQNVRIPIRSARLIVENGGMYARTFLAFGLTEDRVLDAWESDHENFVKIDPRNNRPA